MTKISYSTGIGLKWLASGGEMGERIRALDWSKTALGPVEGWPQLAQPAQHAAFPGKNQAQNPFISERK